MRTMIIAFAALTCSAITKEEPQPPAPRPLYTRVSPDLSKENVAFGSFEYLFWHANMEAYATFGLSSYPYKSPVKYVSQDVNFLWDSGYRVGAGYRMPHDEWELDARWTHFVTHAQGKAGHFPTGSATIGSWFGADIVGTPATPITSMDGRWNFHLDLLDGNLSRYVKITPRLAIKPGVGVRGGWLQQKVQSHMVGGVANSGDAVTIANAHLKNNFKGVGLRGALQSEWNFLPDWSLYGCAGYSLLYGLFSLNYTLNISTVSANPYISTQYPYFFHQMVPMADLSVGFRWDYIKNDTVSLRLQAGWEFNAFFAQNRLASVGALDTMASRVQSEDVTTQGLVFSAQLYF